MLYNAGMGLPEPKLFTLEEYFAFEAAQSEKHEFSYGEVHAQAGASRQHFKIVKNALFALEPYAQRKGCSTEAMDVQFVVSGMAVYYPDLLVTCEPITASKQMAVYSACVVLEVLSPSTRNTDMLYKLADYTRHPTMQTYLLAEQHEQKVYVYQRSHNWEQQIQTTGEIALSCLDMVLTVETLYSGLGFAT